MHGGDAGQPMVTRSKLSLVARMYQTGTKT